MLPLVPVFSIERDGHHSRYLHVGIDSLKLMRAVSSHRDLSNFLAIAVMLLSLPQPKVAPLGASWKVVS
jgi:hypothetical protein